MRQVKYIFAFCLAMVMHASLSNAQGLVINEVVYSNKASLLDSDGESPDWIELYNSDNATLNLDGYMLTDDTTKETFWTLPEYEMAPGTYLVVFASGKNSTDISELHANFKLKMLKENLYLLDPSGAIIDKVNAQCVPTDLSFGLTTDGGENKSVLTPTPGTSNDTASQHTINYQRDSLIIDKPSGLYTDPITVSLSKTYPGSVIYYSLDGDDPDDSGEIYNEPLYLEDYTNHENRFANKPETEVGTGDLIFKGNVLRAIVYSNGCPASNEISNTYFINEKIKSKNTVPFVSIITDEDNLFDNDDGIYVRGNYTNYNRRGKTWERDIHLEVFDTNGIQIIDQDAGLRIHGRASRGAPQKSLRLYARDEYGKEYFDYPFFEQKPELTRFKRLLLRSTEDWSGIIFTDELCQNLVDDMNINYTAANTTLVFINGEYWGIYSLRERQDEYYIADNYNIDPPEIDLISYTPGGLSLETGDMNAYNELIDWVDNSDPESETFYEEAQQYFNLDEVQEYYIAELFLANVDFPSNNLKLWRIKSDTARWHYFFFDMDGSLFRTNFDHLTDYNNTFEDTQRYPEYTTKIFRALIHNTQFRREFTAKFYQHLQTTFSTQTFYEELEKFEALYDPLVAEHTYRWHTPTDYLKWKENVDILSLFAVQRPMEMSQQLYENLGNPFVVYPTVTESGFYIDASSEPENTHVEIYSMTGQMVYSQELTSSLEWIDFDGPQGVYIIKVQMNNMIFSDRIIVK